MVITSRGVNPTVARLATIRASVFHAWPSVIVTPAGSVPPGNRERSRYRSGVPAGAAGLAAAGPRPLLV
ncbi:hypothetical protein [Amycolatopsis sp. MtRt-6]|uniref:hypothetical protein n=1 Tax=Amycolatopsis sp. MtRt-6 TaxID=2792782 RepID=UPI001A8C5B95|nr:hypothetical protein [Amycolatopsis sp. MtRt-6]